MSQQEDLLDAHGGDLRTRAVMDCIEGDVAKATGLKMQDGSIISADILIVGIGIVRCGGPLISAGPSGGKA